MRRTLPAGATPRLVVVDAYPRDYGGAQRVIEQLDRALRGDGWRTTVVVPDDGATADAMRAHGTSVTVLRAPRALLHYGASTRGLRAIAAAAALPTYWWRLAKLVRAAGDVVWVNDLRGLLLTGPAARLARRPLVWHVHSRPRQLRAVAAFAGRLADAVVVASHAAADASGLARATTVLLPNPVDLPRVSRGGRAATPAVVLTVARLHPDKGVDVLVAASALLHRRGVDHRLTVVGAVIPGHEEHAQQIHAAVIAAGIEHAVSFVDRTDDVAALLRTADVYVQPSRSEGMPLATLEAMAAGCAVVATRAGGLPELVDDGCTGVLVDTDCAEQLADAVERLLTDRELAGRLGAAARSHVQQAHSPEQFAATARALADSFVIRR